MLFYVRQKVQDLTTQLAVSVQGYLALDVIRRNNLELIRGVDRATTTTVSASGPAVISWPRPCPIRSSCWTRSPPQHDYLEPDREHSVLLAPAVDLGHEQAASATVDIAKLQTAFDNIYAPWTRSTPSSSRRSKA